MEESHVPPGVCECYPFFLRRCPSFGRPCLMAEPVLSVTASSLLSGAQDRKQYQINKQLAVRTAAGDKLLARGTGRPHTSGVVFVCSTRASLAGAWMPPATLAEGRMNIQ